jgi:predicted secreted hydrolase
MLALVVCLAAASAVAAAAPPVQLPRDHDGHPGSGIEWWYFTALVRDPSGARYSVFFTLFSSKGFFVPVAQVVDLGTGAVVGHSEGLAAGAPGMAALDVKASGSRLRYRPRTNTWSFAVASPALTVSLDQRPEKPYALHGGGTGVIRQALAGSSHYYSASRMRASGTLRVGGKTVAVKGEGWFDHQWGDYADDPRAFNWDWFSCRFDDRTEVMGYRFLDRKGRPLPGLANGTFVAANGRASAVRGLEATPGGRALRAAGRTWPLDWRLHASSPRLSETVRALYADQLVRGTILPTFWEGVAEATGTHRGPCFVEISYR